MSYNQNYNTNYTVTPNILNPLVQLDTVDTVGSIHRSLNNNYNVINTIGKMKHDKNNKSDPKIDPKSDPKIETKTETKIEPKSEPKAETKLDTETKTEITKDANQTEQNSTLKNSKIQNNTSSLKDAPSDLIKENEVINTEQDTIFKQLSYTDVQINLRLLSDLKEGEKVMIVDQKYMQVDQRYGQSFRRYWTSDSRSRTLSFIGHVINWAKHYCNDAVEKINNNDQKQINMEKLINIQTLLRSALTGLSRISTTYSNDKHNLATIETYKSTIQTFCDHDLKRAINEKSPLDQSI